MATSVLINTSYGPFTVALDTVNAPITTGNFLSYVDEGFYDGTIFHRVIDNFMIQGGGLNRAVQAKSTHPPIVLESNNGLLNEQGTIAMARTSVPDSATSQFFINEVDNPFLNYQSASNPGYAVFGKVVDGMDVVNAIAATSVTTVTVNGVSYQNFPYPYFVTIYSVDRYDLAAQATPTTHTVTTNQYGVQIANYSGGRLEYGVKLNADASLTVTKIDGSHTSETLTDIKRLSFSDSQFAYDLSGHAGQAALLINAAFGPAYSTAQIFGEGIKLFDQGQTLPQLSDLAVSLIHALTGASDNANFVKTVYQNIFGTLPDATTLAGFQGVLDRGEMTQPELLTLATESEYNQLSLNLVGLAHSGLLYT